MKFKITGNQTNSGISYYLDDIPVSESEFYRKLHTQFSGEKVKSLNDATPEEWDASRLKTKADDLRGSSIQDKYINAVHEYNAEVASKIHQGVSGKSDGLHADYYTLPKNATQLQDLISHRNMNAQIGEIFRECYRYGLASHSDELRGINKIFFYAKAEKERLERLYANH